MKVHKLQRGRAKCCYGLFRGVADQEGIMSLIPEEIPVSRSIDGTPSKRCTVYAKIVAI